MTKELRETFEFEVGDELPPVTEEHVRNFAELIVSRLREDGVKRFYIEPTETCVTLYGEDGKEYVPPPKNALEPLIARLEQQTQEDKNLEVRPYDTKYGRACEVVLK